MPRILCSLCTSVVTNPTVPPQLSKKTWKRSKNKISFTNDGASTFCSVFNLPSEEFITLLTDFSSALYCPGCSKCIQELHKTANELETLQKRLENIKNELEDKFRDKISSIGPESDDNMLINMLRSYLPSLMVKDEPDDFADAPDEVSFQSFPHLVFSVPDDEISDQSIESQGRRDLKFNPQTGTFDGKSADNLFTHRSKQKVSSHGVKKSRTTIEGGKLTPKKKRRYGSTDKASVGVGRSSDVPILNENDVFHKKSELNEGPQQIPRKRVRNDSQAYTHEKGAGRGHLTPTLVVEKQKILKMIADNPTWSLKTIHENGGSMLKDWNYKERWKKQIKLYEKKREIASSNVCNRCVLGFKQIRVLRDHFLQFHPPRSEFMCTICEFPFQNQEDLTNHTVLHESSPIGEFHCLRCGEIFSNSEDLKIHTWDHDFRQFKCNAKSICYKVFPSEEFLSKHKCREISKKIVCELCGKAFELSYHLTKHKLSHSDAKTFSCHLCPKTVKYAFSLDKHMKQHHADVIPRSTTISKPRRLNKKSKKLIAQELAAAAAGLRRDHNYSKC